MNGRTRYSGVRIGLKAVHLWYTYEAVRRLRHFCTYAPSCQYFYRPLRHNEFRLLVLHPGVEEEPIQCNIQCVSIQEQVEYETLSYCWGSNQPTSEINCQGERLSISQNLSSALKALRHKDKIRRIWVDALCINQDDIPERSSQVRMMSAIFYQSKYTYAWLGPASEDSNLAIRQLKDTANRSSTMANGSRQTISGRPRAVGDLPSGPAVYSLLERAWFTRTWVIQEAAVANDLVLVCGSSSIQWDDLIKAVTHLTDITFYFAYPGHPVYQILMLSRMRQDFQKGIFPSLLNILYHSRAFSASDPRDKIYSLLSLSNPVEIELLGIRPDYSICTRDLYRQFAVSIIKHERNLDIFKAAGPKNPAHIDLPSWVPDWSVSSTTLPLAVRESSSFDILKAAQFCPEFRASKSSACLPNFDLYKDTLTIPGQIIDRIETAGPTLEFHGREGPRELAELFSPSTGIVIPLAGWEALSAAHSRGKNICGDKKLNVFFHTMCAGHWPIEVDQVGLLVKLVRRYSMISFVAFQFIHIMAKNAVAGKALLWMLKVAHYIPSALLIGKYGIGLPPRTLFANNRKMIRTINGYIGLVPATAQPGDSVVLFQGGNVPYLIRSHENGFLLVGECYIHGAMQGELWDSSKLQSIVLG